ncbi:S-layer homology domain-containing protein, partial [Paenibacillus athensensis]|uniref:S-layer homology domain-containing protein n=1 Tax=Paenibacillus athensensis TaxID=1967502 RepID=UPI001E4F8D19
TITFTIDKTAPVVSGVTDSGLYNTNQTPTFNEGTATLDGSAFSSGSTVSAEGAHTLIVTDAAGNVTTVNFTIDKTGPTVTGAADLGNYNTNRTLTISDGTATLDGSAFTSGSTVSAEGSHTLIATDAAGNTTTITFTIDKTAPVVSGVIDGSFYNVDKTITFNEGTATLDGSAFSSGDTVSADGPHTLVVTDAAGNTTTVTFTLDTTGPTVTGAADGVSYNTDRTLTLSDGTATLDGAAFTSGSTVSAEGSHTLIATDAAGNITTITFTIDKTVPVVSGATDGSLYNVNKTITFNEGTATLDGLAFTSGSTVSAEGAHTLIVTDAAGNATTVNFTIDKTGPTITGAADGVSYNTDRTITLSDGTATLDGSAFTSGSTVSAEGSHTLIATDAAGNTTTITFTVDKTAPVVTGVSNAGLYNVNKTVTFNEGTATLNGSAFVSGTTISADGAYTLIVTDAAGNATTVNFSIDKTAPVITGVMNNGSYTSDLTVSFNEGTATLDGAGFTSGNTVSAEGSHTLIVTDAAGNSTTIQFVLDKTAPTGTITINNGDALTKQKHVDLTITGTDGTGVGGIQARFSNDNTDWTAWENIPSTLSWTLTNGKGTKTVYMQLKDALGNTSTSLTDTINYKSVPQIVNYLKSAQDTQVITLSAGFFGYSNEDDSVLQKIKIIALPAHGSLKFNNVLVTAGQEIDLADIDKLVYTPQRGWSGTAQLVWNGYDGELYADSDATVSFATRSSSSAAPTGPIAGAGQESVQVIVNGVVQEQLATAKTENLPDGRKSSMIMIDEDKMNAKLEKEGNKALVTIPFTKDTDQVFGVLNGQMVKNMENREAVLQVQTNNASYTIPAQQINIDAVSAAFDKSIALRDIQVKVEITNLAPNSPAVTTQKQKNGNVVIIAPAFEFKLTGSYGGKEVEVSQFNAYVERTIAIPDGVDPKKITTGVVAMPDGTFVHVPTKVIQKDGKYYAVINSLTNSIYSVVYNEKTFADVEHHWSRDVVDEMGARMVINGVDDEHFAPDQAITRAEFTAVMVRALGLREAHKTLSYSDVSEGDWYYTAIAIAQEYGLIQGYSESEFGPGKLISRQEAMVIIQRALKLAGHDNVLSNEQIAAQLGAFADKGEFGNWAASAAALCMDLHIVEGSDGLARPASNITRAETAAMIKRMLEAANLI